MEFPDNGNFTGNGVWRRVSYPHNISKFKRFIGVPFQTAGIYTLPWFDNANYYNSNNFNGRLYNTCVEAVNSTNVIISTYGGWANYKFLVFLLYTKYE